jgi:5'-phosphate synthase pdxT subunit
MKTVGILSLQGCVDPHKKHLKALGVEVVEVKRSEDFKKIDGLILPGGESTTMLKLIDHFQIWNDLKESAEKIPYWGVCAGSILMAKKVSNPVQKSLGIMDLDIERNGYGRQVDSHNVTIDKYEVSFIRAPVISRVGKSCKVLASHLSKPVWIRQGRHVISTFHAELNNKFPSPFHKEFLQS